MFGIYGYGANEQLIVPNPRGDHAITQFAADSGKEQLYRLTQACTLYQYPFTEQGYILAQSPSNPVLEFEAGAFDGNYDSTYCQVERGTYNLYCGTSVSTPGTDYSCSYSYT